MGKTTLTNKVGFNVQVKEGIPIISRNLQVLKPGNSMTIKANSSFTYQEYALILLPDNKKLRPLISEDIEELDAIEIFQDEETGEVDWRPLRKGAEKKSCFHAVLGWFSQKAGRKADAEANPKTDANVEANADSSKSPTATQ